MSKNGDFFWEEKEDSGRIEIKENKRKKKRKEKEIKVFCFLFFSLIFDLFIVFFGSAPISIFREEEFERGPRC